ncbi:MAG TPA: molybdopterin-binding protein [Myxococcales bacterium]|nr:molybdopterin-binding protein [Myxococcales bacterium]
MSGGTSAAVVIVGNEILSAKVRDENGPFLLSRLRELGVDARRLLVVADEIDEIVWAIASLRREVDWILTTGGVGPTHDDVTVAGVARALGRPVVRHPDLVALVERHYGAGVEAAAFRLADVPAGAELVYQPGIWIPALQVERIVLLPGVPQLCRIQFEAVAPRLTGNPFTLKAVYVSAGEPAIAAALDAVADGHPRVALGSYPRFDREADHKVKLTLESRDAAAVAKALEDLLARLPEGCVLRQE